MPLVIELLMLAPQDGQFSAPSVSGCPQFLQITGYKRRYILNGFVTAQTVVHFPPRRCADNPNDAFPATRPGSESKLAEHYHLFGGSEWGV
jgi:hypothetical protein